MSNTHASPRSHPMPQQPVRLWLLALGTVLGCAVGATVATDYGLAWGLFAGGVYGGAVATYAIAGRRALDWLSAHRVASTAVFGALAFVTLVGLHVFTPLEDLVVGLAAGLAVTSLRAAG